jgi:hypothetical protein
MPARLKETLLSANFPFELIMETVASCSDPTPLYGIYQSGDACAFHYLTTEFASGATPPSFRFWMQERAAWQA